MMSPQCVVDHRRTTRMWIGVDHRVRVTYAVCMFYIQQVTGFGRDDWRPWGDERGYTSRHAAVEALIAARPEGTYRVVERGR